MIFSHNHSGDSMQMIGKARGEEEDDDEAFYDLESTPLYRPTAWLMVHVILCKGKCQDA